MDRYDVWYPTSETEREVLFARHSEVRTSGYNALICDPSTQKDSRQECVHNERLVFLTFIFPCHRRYWFYSEGGVRKEDKSFSGRAELLIKFY
jgi:hypothetical protein